MTAYVPVTHIDAFSDGRELDAQYTLTIVHWLCRSSACYVLVSKITLYSFQVANLKIQLCRSRRGPC